MKTVALILFIITYVLMILLSDKRPFVALASAVLYVILGIMPAKNVFSAIDWNVLMMLAGTMGTVALFIESKMPNRLADQNGLFGLHLHERQALYLLGGGAGRPGHRPRDHAPLPQGKGEGGAP